MNTNPTNPNQPTNPHTNPTNPHTTPTNAFTLIELLLVLVILATLAALVLPKFAGRTQQAKTTAAQTQIANLEIALDTYEIDNGHYPKTGNLNALTTQPNNTPHWNGPYLKKTIPNDPWGNPYNYQQPGKNNPTTYDLSSNGPDGQPGNQDDITNWTNN